VVELNSILFDSIYYNEVFVCALCGRIELDSIRFNLLQSLYCDFSNSAKRKLEQLFRSLCIFTLLYFEHSKCEFLSNVNCKQQISCCSSEA